METNHKKNIQKSFLLFFILAFCLLNSTQALMIKLSLHRLTNEAEAIILGKVEDIQCEWSLDRDIILSVVTLRIQEILKGDFYAVKIFIQYPGGKVGDISLKVSDMPDFQMNEHVLVFLKSIDINNTKNSPKVAQNFLPAYELFGAAQGKYYIDANGIAHKGGYDLITSDYEPEKSLPLTDLKTKIFIMLQQNFKEKDKTYEKNKR